jgi:hypothetical protein
MWFAMRATGSSKVGWPSHGRGRGGCERGRGGGGGGVMCVGLGEIIYAS